MRIKFLKNPRKKTLLSPHVLAKPNLNISVIIYIYMYLQHAACFSCKNTIPLLCSQDSLKATLHPLMVSQVIYTWWLIIIRECFKIDRKVRERENHHTWKTKSSSLAKVTAWTWILRETHDCFSWRFSRC
jgi:hypothetical protein